MKYYLLSFCLFLVYATESSAQFGTPQVIDSDQSSGGNRYMTTADIDNNGFTDILVAKAYDYDQVSVYWNNGMMNFQEAILTNLSDPVYIQAEDISNNGWKDFLVITESSGELYYYKNNNGSFANPQLIDTEPSFGKAIQIDDFNEDGNLDFVVIWQHAINLYLNNTDGTFTKSPILTTSSSPNILECWTMDKGDINNDGHIDIITGETLGAVVYENDGQANFTPHLVTPSTHSTLTVLKVFDANNDNHLDIVAQRAGGAVSLYTHTTNGFNYTYESDLFTTGNNSVKRLYHIDFNGDGQEDIYTVYEGKPSLHLQENNLSFSSSMLLDDDPDLFVDQIALADLDNNGQQEFLWSAASQTLAYQKNENLSTSSPRRSALVIYPNPTTGKIYMNQPINKYRQLSIYSLTGKKVYAQKITGSTPSINLTFLPSGIYLMQCKSERDTFQKKLIIQ